MLGFYEAYSCHLCCLETDIFHASTLFLHFIGVYSSDIFKYTINATATILIEQNAYKTGCHDI
jgi:hypothetical protein